MKIFEASKKTLTTSEKKEITSIYEELKNISSDDKIKEAGRYYYANEKNTKILKRFSRASHLAYINDPIKDNNTGYSDFDVKEFLKIYDKINIINVEFFILYYKYSIFTSTISRSCPKSKLPKGVPLGYQRFDPGAPRRRPRPKTRPRNPNEGDPLR
mgnify:CR=1 FL=1